MSASHPGNRPLVTVLGASGFLGSAVTAALARRRIRLRAVCRSPLSWPEGVEVCRADLGDPRQLRAAVAGSDAVVHLVLHQGGWRGADTDPASERVNVGIVRGLADLFDGRDTAPVVLFAGSTSQAATGPVSTYDRQKQAAERLLESATAAGVLRGISLRLPTVFGHLPGAEGTAKGVLTAMTRRALAGEPLTLWRDVERDFLHVRDVATAFLAALDNPAAVAGTHWPVGTGHGRRLGDVFRTIAWLVARRTGRPPVPVRSVPPPPDAVATDLVDHVSDPSRFTAATGWRAEVPFLPALAAAIDAQLASRRAA